MGSAAAGPGASGLAASFLPEVVSISPLATPEPASSSGACGLTPALRPMIFLLSDPGQLSAPGPPDPDPAMPVPELSPTKAQVASPGPRPAWRPECPNPLLGRGSGPAV